VEDTVPLRVMELERDNVSLALCDAACVWVVEGLFERDRSLECVVERERERLLLLLMLGEWETERLRLCDRLVDLDGLSE
jgi:hypothetical protein